MHTVRLSYALIVAFLFTALLPTWQQRSATAQSLPKRIPAGAQEATIAGYDDGDKFKVKIDGKTETVLLISADAPEKDECFAKESAKQLKKYLPEDSTVYLESDKEDRDGKNRLLRYAWVVNDDGKATFVDERMVATGNSTFKNRDDNTVHDKRLKKAEQKAKKEKRGLWKTCGGGHVKNTPVPQATEPPSEGVGLAGEGDDKQDHFVKAGTYSVEAYCDNVAMQVYINGPNGDLVAWPVNRSRLDEPANDAVIPADGVYEFEIYCGGTVGEGQWFVRLTLK